MPVTAKLSRRFYEQFGDEVTNELVNWFNAVDETYRSQLRELNELNWERFRSELRAEGASIRAEMDKRFSAVDLRFAAVDARFDRVATRLDGIATRLDSINLYLNGVDARFDGTDARFDGTDARLDGIDTRFDGTDTRLDGIDGKLGSMKKEFPSMEERIETKLDAKFARFETRMYRGMFVFWTATTIPLAVLIVTLSGALQR